MTGVLTPMHNARSLKRGRGPAAGGVRRRRTSAAAPARARRLTTAERRQQLIDTARAVFADHGFRGTTTREIALAAGVTEAVIFQHFRDKDSLYAAILEQKAAEPESDAWIDALEATAAAGDDIGLVTALVSGLIDQHERDPFFFRLTLFSALEHHPLASRLHPAGIRLYRLLESYIEAGQAAGRLRPGAAPVLVRGVLALPVYHLLQRRVLRTPWPAVDREALLDTGVKFVLSGLLRQPIDEVRA